MSVKNNYNHKYVLNVSSESSYQDTLLENVECPICFECSRNINYQTCSNCEYKWCTKCINESRKIYNNYNNKYKYSSKTQHYFKELISSKSCPVCRNFRTFVESKDDDLSIIFKTNFINYIEEWTTNWTHDIEKEYTCLNCNLTQKSNKVIPQCNICSLFNMILK